MNCRNTSTFFHRAWRWVGAATLVGALLMTSGAYGQGNTCATATVITLPYSLASGTTCGGVDDYNSGNTGSCSSNSYKQGEDILWQFVAPGTGNVTITFTDNSGGAWMAAHLFQNCPAGGTCIGQTGCAGCAAHSGTYPVTSGLTYFVMMDNWPSPACGTFANLSITFAAGGFDPCTSIGAISACGAATSTTFAAGAGAYNPPSATCGFSTPGQEKYYTFTPATTGGYQIAQTASFGYIDYFFKAAAGGCSGSGWSCIDDLNGTMTSFGSFALTAGTQYYILLDPEGSGGGAVTFSVVCPSPCTSIGAITGCGVATSTTIASGTGVYDFTGTYPTNSCGFGTPGNEKIYTFTPVTTGVHQIAQTASFGWIDYLYKPVSGGCSGTGWTCIDDLSGTMTSSPGVTLTAGTQYYIMLDAESTGGGVVTFSVACPAGFDPCASIGAIPSCGAATSTTIAAGNGGYNFSGTYPTNSCGFGTPGQEKIYTFTPTVTGVHLIAQTASFGYIDYLYKPASGGCNATGWTCIDDLNGAVTSTPGFSLTAGTQYYIILDAEGTGGGAVTFSVVCPSPCTSIGAIASCGVSTSTTIAPGTGVYDFTGTYPTNSCGFSTPGQEKIYTYTPPVTGSYQITQTASFGWIDYLYKPVSAGCSGTGWTCIDDLSGAMTSTSVALTGGTQYYILLDPEGTGGGTVTFSVACPPPPANDACANAINVTSYPYTSPVINNAFATDDFSTGIAGYACNAFGGPDGPYKNIWWRVTGVCGTMTAQTCASTFDNEMGVYTGSCGSLTYLTCNDDNGPSCAGTRASVTWTATQGTIYYIAVGNWGTAGGTGDIVLNVTVADTDGDGVGNTCDNCVNIANPTQVNTDGDALGDACDACPNDPANDSDGDGVCGDVDNCPLVANPLQENADADAFGDACDTCPNDATNDGDGDGVCENVDNCPGVANASQANFDADAQGDACDPDDDNDGLTDTAEAGLGTNPFDPDTDDDGFGDAADNCPLVTGVVGSVCDANAGPGFTLGELNGSCVCAPVACTQNLTIELQTDANPNQITWELREQITNVLIQSGTPTPPNGIQTMNTCVPNGCYYLKVIDSGGDGITNGGYILRTAGSPGTRIIDNRRNFGNLPGGPPDVSQIAGGEGFCVPIGTTTSPIYTSCDKLDWVTGEYIVCSSAPAVSALWNAGNTPAEATTGYEFQIFNPNGGYIFNRFRSHAVSDGFSPDIASRACHMKINNWAAAQHIPANVLMNVRVRTRINGVNANWGPACRFKIDPVRAACPLTKLTDIPGEQYYSCGSTRAWGTGNYVYARPVSGATQYQWRFRIDAESFISIRTTTTYFVQLNWATFPLQNGKTYQVEVRAFKAGAWCIDTPTPTPGPNWVAWGDVCDLTIDNTPMNGGENFAPEEGAALHMYPNPNRGDQLYLSLDAVQEGVQTVSVDIVDLYGKRVSTRTIPVTDGFVNTVLDLDGTMANGMYMVNITAGEQRYTERLVIQR